MSREAFAVALPFILAPVGGEGKGLAISLLIFVFGRTLRAGLSVYTPAGLRRGAGIHFYPLRGMGKLGEAHAARVRQRGQKTCWNVKSYMLKLIK